MKDIIIYGSGSIGRLTEQIIHDINQYEKKWNIVGFIDDNDNLHKQKIANHTVLGGIEVLQKFDSISIVIAIGNTKSRLKLYELLKNDYTIDFPILIHPSAIIPQRVGIEKGTIIYPGVIIDVDVKIGRFNILNKLVTIGHDTKVGGFCILSPGVKIGGNVIIEDGVEMGINSCTIQNLRIGAWSIIGAGGAVINEISPYTVNVGVPTKSIKNRLQE